ncbi:MAG: hypothetical protein PHW02_00420 [bacterium]|mgnify:CR=1 FL=1|nr:hypothetical protein [bacterium]
MKKILFALFSILCFVSLSSQEVFFPPVLSLLIPGGGQFYNKEYVKGAVIAAAELTLCALLYENCRKDEPSSSLYRDLLVGIKLFSSLDAYVFAELKENLSGEAESDTIQKK